MVRIVAEDDVAKDDWWFHRHRQLDRQDQQAAIERDLANMRLRTGFGPATDPRSAEPRSSRPSTDQLAGDIVAAYRDAVARLQDDDIPRAVTAAWASTLLDMDPLAPGSAARVEDLASEMKDFLGRTSQWELGGGSLSRGMLIHDHLNLTRSILVTLSLDLQAYARR